MPNLKEVDAIRHLDPIEPLHTFIRLSIIGAPSGTHGSSTLDQALIIQHWLVPVVREAGLEGADQLNIDSDTDLVAGWDTVTMRTGVSTHLAAALADAEPGLLTLRSDPVWDDLRHDSRFEGLLSEARDLRFSPTMRGRRGGGRNPGNNR